MAILICKQLRSGNVFWQQPTTDEDVDVWTTVPEEAHGFRTVHEAAAWAEVLQVNDFVLMELR